MMLPELISDPTSFPSSGPSRTGGSGRTVRNELLRRHLIARVGAAREQLRALEDHDQAPAALVARVGATVAEAQRAIAAEHAEARTRSAALLRIADVRAAEILADADAEARVLRAMVTWLRQVPVGVPRQVSTPSPAATVEASRP
jgi:hypothetical protein